MQDADARRALLLILAALERHSRALRTLLAGAGHPGLEGLLGAFARRERALREAAWQLRALAARDAAGPTNRRRGTADGLARQGVLLLPELNGTTDAAATACLIHSAVERRSEKLGTGRPMATGRAGTTKGVSHRTREAVREAARTRASRR